MQSTSVFEGSRPTYPSCHAATLVALSRGRLLAAWFAGPHEGHPDVSIWLARFDGGRWQDPVRLVDEPGVPLWNPVLFRDAAGVVWLFYKAGPAVPAWTGRVLKSRDEGRTWSPPAALPAGLLGPAKNKPLTLASGEIICGTSAETWRSWTCWVEISTDGGATWQRCGPLVAPGDGEGPVDVHEPVSATWDARTGTLTVPQNHPGIIQPTLWEVAPGHVCMLVRATRRVGFVCASSSTDYGRTWAAVLPTSVPCPNSGLDAVRLADGRLVLACNPVHEGRTPLSLLVSDDNGMTWPWRRDLETGPGEYSYPSIVQAPDGLVHVVYTHRRTSIRHLMLDPDELASPE